MCDFPPYRSSAWKAINLASNYASNIKPINMKQIVAQVESTTIPVDTLIGTEVVAYRAKPSGIICILGKISGSRWGFIPFKPSGWDPTFQGNNFWDSVRIAIMTRKVYIFNNEFELARAIVDNTF